MKQKHRFLDFEIDKLTNSIENIITGDSFPTDIAVLTKADLKNITKKNGWEFSWNQEFKRPDRQRHLQINYRQQSNDYPRIGEPYRKTGSRLPSPY